MIVYTLWNVKERWVCGVFASIEAAQAASSVEEWVPMAKKNPEDWLRSVDDDYTIESWEVTP